MPLLFLSIVAEMTLILYDETMTYNNSSSAARMNVVSIISSYELSVKCDARETTLVYNSEISLLSAKDRTIVSKDRRCSSTKEYSCFNIVEGEE